MTAIRSIRPVPLAAKIGGTAALVLLAEIVFATDSEVGGVIGLLALAWVAVLVIVRPVVLRDRAARIAAIAAAGYGLVLIDDPNVLALTLGWIAITLAALLPRRRFDSAFAWARRVAWHGIVSLGLPWRDGAWAAHARRRQVSQGGTLATATMLIVPLLGGAVFLTLFANANPLIGQAFDRISLPDLGDVVWRTVLGAVAATAAWATLRPRPAIATGDALDAFAVGARWDMGVATLALSLVTFNAIFALQNALDLIFLWSGAALPDGVTLADYAHRGAYALIVTAVLAGVFVLVTLRPGSVAAASPAVRRLVTIWIVQNLLLVASSALRLFDYIAVYGWTTLRLAALAWMALVATGLALILWRLLRGRSATWLINANALAAALVLSVASVVDLGATAAAWNARIAITEGRAGPPLDLCYLAQLGPSGLVALAHLERHAKGAGLKDRIGYLRSRTQRNVVALQQDWRSWSGRNARRLQQVDALVGTRPPTLREGPHGRGCDGQPFPPPQRVIPPVPPAPLTKAVQR